jgi:site-specific DNA-cytosine methylase
VAVVTRYWFVKSRRAQNEHDDETWNRGGVCTTLNAFDNGGESRATVLIIDGTRVGDVRVTDEETMQTVIQRWGTGGGNVPAIAYESENVAPTLTAYNMDSRSPQSEEQQRIVNAVYTNTLQVRRLTPMECERLQGFPDGWTASQSDSQRYRQMGNAVTVNVIESIGQQLGRVSNG